MLKFLKYTLLILALFLLSCDSRNRAQSKIDCNSTVRFDTASFISQLNLRESCSKLELINLDTVDLKDELDTLVLKYIPYACHCPYWVDATEYDRIESKIDFNQYKYSYYIEPASDECKLNDRFCCNGNMIKFIGKEHRKIRHAENTEVKNDAYSPGRFFRYYSYEIIKPYTIWGPKVCDSDIDLNGTHNYYQVQLKVD